MSEEEQKRSEPELREQQIAVPQTSNLDIFIDDLLIFSKKRNKFIIFSIAIISVLTLLIYSNIYDNSRHFDDDFIFLNNDVHNPSDVMKVFQINPFRFITFYSFSLNYAFSGDKLFSYYLINVLIHIVNSILIFLIAVSIFETPKLANTNFARYKMLYSLAIALIFATHPLQTQSVTYIYQRLNSLGAFFYFTSVFLYIRFRLSDKKFLRKSWILLLSLVAVLFGLFSKENTFTLPFVFVLLEITLLNKKFTVNIIYIFLALVIVAFGVALFFLFQIPERVF